MIIRQGDLMLRRVSDASTDETPRPVTLAIGEESGHSHVLDGFPVTPLGDQGRGVVEVLAPTNLRVEGMPWRHDPIPVSPGRYEFWIQRELTAEQEVVRVTD